MKRTEVATLKFAVSLIKYGLEAGRHALLVMTARH